MKRVLLLLLLLVATVGFSQRPAGDTDPSIEISAASINFGEVPQNQSVTKYIKVTGANLGSEPIDLYIGGTDASYFSYETATGWDSSTGGYVLVTYTATVLPTGAAPYSHQATLWVSCPSLNMTEFVPLTGAVEGNYYCYAYVDTLVYPMNSRIPIYAYVYSATGGPVENATVDINVTVMGMKRTFTEVTNDQGVATAMFEPLPGESGYYSINACRSGVESTAEHAQFYIPGLSLCTPGNILCKVEEFDTKEDSVLIRNKSDIYLNNVTLVPVELPYGCSFESGPLNLDAGEERYFAFDITGTDPMFDDYYEPIKVKAISDEGAEVEFTIWYYCTQFEPISVFPNDVVATVTSDESKIVDVMLVNNTSSETGVVHIMPDDAAFLMVVGCDSLPSIPAHDTAYVSLRILHDEIMSYLPNIGDVIYGSVNIVSPTLAYELPVSVMYVDDFEGSLDINIINEFMINKSKAADDPVVANAEVTANGYHSLEMSAHGFTGSDGTFQTSGLPEGYYTLSISVDEHHAEYNGIIQVLGGTNNIESFFLDYMPVTYSWVATPTGSGDYTYELAVDYKPDISAPVITIDCSGIHELSRGGSAEFTLVLTNHGREDAYDTHIVFSKSSEYTFTPLFEVIDTIPASGKVEIPGRYSRSYTAATLTEEDCDVHVSTVSFYTSPANSTGQSLVQNRSLPFNLGELTTCQPTAENLESGFPSINDSSSDPFSSLNDDKGGGTPVIGEEFGDPCLSSLSGALGDCLPATLPGTAILTVLSGATSNIAANGPYNIEQLLLDHLWYFLSESDACVDGGWWDIKDCLWATYDGLDGCATAKSGELGLQNTINQLYNSAYYYFNEYSYVKTIFSAEVWNKEENIFAFIDAFKSLLDSSTGLISADDASSLASSFVGTAVKSTEITAFINRWNRSIGYWTSGYFTVSDLPDGYDPDFIQIDNALINEIIAIRSQYVSAGYVGMNMVYQDAIVNGKALVGSGSPKGSVSIKKSFAKESILTGEELMGTFTIHNGNASTSMGTIGLDFVVKDEDGIDRTSWFDVSTFSLKQIASIDGSGTVEPKTDAVAKIKFIPSVQAAPSVPKVYYFGGTFTFTDPYTSSVKVHNMYPVAITVKPGPDLCVDYFVPRYILGDDTLTLDRCEPSVPAELGVIIKNQGVLAAENVTLETAKPGILNSNGFGIDYLLDSVMFNGTRRLLGMMDVPFGHLATDQIAVGEWQFTSDQIGFFEDYRSHVVHNSSEGNTRLSLVSHMATHQLVRPIRVYGDMDDDINDFLIDGDPDANNYPDTIYFSHGGKTLVRVANNVSFDHVVGPLDTIVTLTVSPSGDQWNYGVCDDPGGDKYELVSCKRTQGNIAIPLNNIWQTYVTLNDGSDPVYENKLHIVDKMPANVDDVTYTLVYTVKSDLLHVVEITGIPDTELDHSLETFRVSFSKPIVETTFTYEDMTLTCMEGANLMDATVMITKVCDSVFDVNISSLTGEDGIYELEINTLNISDYNGYEGFKSKLATWTQVTPIYMQTDAMSSGWNWWSPFISMTKEQDLDQLKTALGGNASMIKSRNDGFLTYYDNAWYGTLTMLHNSEMYMIDMDSDQDITIEGHMADVAQNPVTLNPGWNWIGYPSNKVQSVGFALENLAAAENDVLKTRTQTATYSTSLGWTGSLATMTPGGGYMYYYGGTSTISFVYKMPGKDEIPDKAEMSNHWEMPVGEYEMNATVIGVIEVDGEEQRDETMVVGAFIGDHCVGQANALYIEGLDRYMVFLNYFGTVNDEVTFRLYDETAGVEYGTSENMVLFEANALVGTLEQPMAIRFATTSVIESYAKDVVLFPNPVKSNEKVRMTLEGGLADGMEMELLSPLGVQLYKTEVRGDVLEMTAPVTSGVYIVKITHENGAVYYGKLFVE